MIVRSTKHASDDLTLIYDDLAAGSIDVAERVIQRIDRRCQSLRSFPERGRKLDLHGRPDLRRVIQEPYIIVNRVVDEDVWIVTLVHGSRDPAAILHALDRGE